MNDLGIIEEKKTACYYYEAVQYVNETIRYYRLEPSENLCSSTDGMLVHRRISKKEWEKIK